MTAARRQVERSARVRLRKSSSPAGPRKDDIDTRYRVGGDRAIRRLCPRIGRQDCRSRRATLHPPAKSKGSKGLYGSAERVARHRNNGVGRRPEPNAKAGGKGEKRAMEAQGRRQSRTRGGGRIRARGRASGPSEGRTRRRKTPRIEEASGVDATGGEAVLAGSKAERPRSREIGCQRGCSPAPTSDP